MNNQKSLILFGMMTIVVGVHEELRAASVETRTSLSTPVRNNVNAELFGQSSSSSEESVVGMRERSACAWCQDMANFIQHHAQAIAAAMKVHETGSLVTQQKVEAVMKSLKLEQPEEMNWNYLMGAVQLELDKLHNLVDLELDVPSSGVIIPEPVAPANLSGAINIEHIVEVVKMVIDNERAGRQQSEFPVPAQTQNMRGAITNVGRIVEVVKMAVDAEQGGIIGDDNGAADEIFEEFFQKKLDEFTQKHKTLINISAKDQLAFYRNVISDVIRKHPKIGIFIIYKPLVGLPLSDTDKTVYLSFLKSSSATKHDIARSQSSLNALQVPGLSLQDKVNEIRLAVGDMSRLVELVTSMSDMQNLVDGQIWILENTIKFGNAALSSSITKIVQVVRDVQQATAQPVPSGTAERLS